MGYVSLSWKSRLKLVRMALSTAHFGVIKTHYTETLIPSGHSKEPEKSLLELSSPVWTINWFGELHGIIYWIVRASMWSCLIVGLLALNLITVIISLICLLYCKVEDFNRGAMVRVEFGKKLSEVGR